MPAAIITTDDLHEFKLELFERIREILLEKAVEEKNKTWLRSKDVMGLLKISHGTLQNLRNNDTIPSHKIEGLIFYDAHEIDKILMDNRTIKHSRDR
ncbi:Helix-turn-helix domain-containing protein [Pricia antarctica]|uniref:Helix-turn-helix domain-containing protein n=1 Tax=Pricia antarctica TaxID=641691 RepID=A0A1G7HHV1_9FLAO|nr:helix-turn-helix domain-containing protein [Pricia antarctica]SDE99854.1 Helix-turn-helix domain-containing protein [Pricia antarctica]